jgi:hypothetical protein
MFSVMFSLQSRLVNEINKKQVMKRMVFAFSIMLISACAMGQRNDIDTFFERYAGLDGYTTVNISGNLFNLFSDNENNSETKKITLDISSVRILSVNEEYENGSINFVKELENSVERGGYEELMIVKDSQNDVRIMVKTRGRIINELLILTGGKDNALVQIKGHFEKKDLITLSHADINGVSYLEKLEDDVN